MFNWFRKAKSEVVATENSVKFFVSDGKIICDLEASDLEVFSDLVASIVSGSLNVSLLSLIEENLAEDEESKNYLLNVVYNSLPEEVEDQALIKPNDYGKVYA